MNFNLLLDPIVQSPSLLLFEVVLIRRDKQNCLLLHLSYAKITLSILYYRIMFKLV